MVINLQYYQNCPIINIKDCVCHTRLGVWQRGRWRSLILLALSAWSDRTGDGCRCTAARHNRFLLQHCPVERVVILVIQRSKQNAEHLS